MSVEDCPPATQYTFVLDGLERPDPASRMQVSGVHGPSQVVAIEPPHVPAPELKLSEYVIYELHLGTFTPEGTFDGAIGCLDRLQRLGVTAIEIMPIAEFPGERNWGYDGVFPFAVQKSYGGPQGLRRFVEACHLRGLAVILDVVYNHLGPEGNYLRDFGPYFTDSYKIPWGQALNFDGPHSDHVRRFFIENALYWLAAFDIDALRLDAVHAIFDRSAYPFLQELADRVRELTRERYLIAESDLNDVRLIRPARNGGIGLDAQWADDLHHALHALLTGERSGYYADYGESDHLAAALEKGWLFTGQYSRVRQRRFGNSPEETEPWRLVVCSQNHDQVGNRMTGDRLVHLVGFERARLAAATVILSPYTPLLFMGEEYAEPAPFLYHVSHSDPALTEAIRSGRREEFAGFLQQGEPPHPDEEETFLRSKLHQGLASEGVHAQMHAYYAQLLELRRTLPEGVAVEQQDGSLIMRRGSSTVVVLRFAERAGFANVALAEGRWKKVLDSSSEQWGGDGGCAPDLIESRGETVEITVPPWSAVVYALATRL